MSNLQNQVYTNIEQKYKYTNIIHIFRLSPLNFALFDSKGRHQRKCVYVWRCWCVDGHDLLLCMPT